MERSDGFKDMFLLASILLMVSTVFHSSVAVIIRHLKSVPVASLNSSREIVLVIISYLFILIGDIQIYAPTLTEKLKLLLFSKHTNNKGSGIKTMINAGCCVTAQVTLSTFALKLENAGAVAIVDR